MAFCIQSCQYENGKQEIEEDKEEEGDIFFQKEERGDYCAISTSSLERMYIILWYTGVITRHVIESKPCHVCRTKNAKKKTIIGLEKNKCMTKNMHGS